MAQEALWDRIFRADRHSRGSHYFIGLSAYEFEKHQPQPEKGMLQLPDRPGFGIEPDESRIEAIRSLSWQQL
jgi:L-alanine-DL-glutamate epimerase-like enolase superfamily enzyme